MAPDTIFGSIHNGYVLFTSNQATARCDGSECAFAFRGVGLNSDGNQMEEDVFCHLSCDQMKVQNDWVNNSKMGRARQAWINNDNERGTGDHEQYR